jgi:cyclic GMP-AMP synthase
MTLANANALFQGLKSKPSFTNAIHIKVGDNEDKLLLGARNEIRRQIRSAFSEFRKYLKDSERRKELYEDRGLDFKAEGGLLKSVDIRFLTQGSRAYGTLIRPAQPAFQEIDLDDGVYFPMPFVNDRPVFSSKALFKLITDILAPLVEKYGWEIEPKDTCLRVILTNQNAHIDLPLFAVRQASFQLLTDAYEKQTGQSVRKSQNLNDSFDNEARSLRLEQSDILLAHREKDWIPSDPKEIHDWFIDQVARFGQVLRRSIRYSKAWRDNLWAQSDLSSIALMIACRDCIAELGERPASDRDDLMMLRIAERLPDRIRRGNLCWREGGPAVCADWDDGERENMALAMEAFAEALDAALNLSQHPKVVVDRLRATYGERFPDAPESVAIKRAAQTSEVVNTKPTKVSFPLVGTSVSA